MSKVKACPACGKDVATSAKVCPHCGKKLKMGLFLQIILGVLILGALGAVFGPSEEEKAQKLSLELESIAKSQAATISSRGELSEAFSIMSKYTDIQRDNLEKEIKGKIVQWSLPVYEVKKKSENIYRIQTKSGTDHVGAFLTLHTRSATENAYVEDLKTGNSISFKGKITGITMRNIDIDPAVLMAR